MHSFCHSLNAFELKIRFSDVNVQQTPWRPNSDADYAWVSRSAVGWPFCISVQFPGNTRLWVIWGPWLLGCQRIWPWIQFGDRTEGLDKGGEDWEGKANSTGLSSGGCKCFNMAAYWSEKKLGSVACAVWSHLLRRLTRENHWVQETGLSFGDTVRSCFLEVKKASQWRWLANLSYLKESEAGTCLVYTDFKASLGNLVKPCFKIKKKTNEAGDLG